MNGFTEKQKKDLDTFGICIIEGKRGSGMSFHAIQCTDCTLDPGTIECEKTRMNEGLTLGQEDE